MNLSKNEQRIYDYCKSNDIQNLKIAELAHLTFTTASSVSKLSKKLGFKNFSSFKNFFISGIEKKEIMHLDEFSTKYINSILKSVASVNVEKIEELCSYIENSKNIVLYGIGTSSHAAKYMSSSLVGLGYCSYIDDNYYNYNKLMKISEDAIVIIFSHSGNTSEVCRIIEEVDNTIISITSNENSELAKKSNLVINYDNTDLLKRDSGNTSTSIQIFISDIILNNLYSNID